MPKIKYIDKRFRKPSREIVESANTIVSQYQNMGYDITLRQLYYQFIAKDLFPNEWIDRKYNLKHHLDPDTKNTDKNYKKLGGIINDARLAGLIDWHAITDRTRNLRSNSHWDDPRDILNSAAEGFAIDRWKNQEYRPECFPPNTPVITPDGTTAIASLEIGDHVLTHHGRMRQVTKIIENQWDGNLIQIRAVGLLPVSMTPNHPVLVRRWDSERTGGCKGAERRYLPPQLIPAEDIKPYDLLMIPRFMDEYDTSFVNMQGGIRSRHFYDVPVSDDFLAVIGIYLAEGNIRPDKRTVQFTMNANEEHQSNIITRWADSVGINHHLTFGKGTRIVYLFGKAVADFMASEFGNGAYHKRMSEWTMRLPLHKQLRMIEYYCRGDGSLGHKSHGGLVMTSRSKDLVTQLQLAFLRHGYIGNATVQLDHGKPRYQISVTGKFGSDLGKQWNIKIPFRKTKYNHTKIDDKFGYYPVRTTMSIPYKGNVYNLEVSEDHTYCVPIIVHNCFIEKDALVGILQAACDPLDVPYFSCRGYTSVSELWVAAQRMKRWQRLGQTPVVIHLGDHDPSGIDMSRDVKERLELFGATPEFRRIALNWDQVQEYHPPPNPAKSSDSRFNDYQEKFGDESWELDALDPATLVGLITETILEFQDRDEWESSQEEEQAGKEKLRRIHQRWDEISEE